MIYTEITNEDKVALHSGNCAIKTKIIVSPGTEEEVVLTEQNSVKSWEHTEERYTPDVGFIGQFVARELTGELHNISDDFNIENKKIELQMAILRTELDFRFLTTENGIYLITEDGKQIYVDEIADVIETWYSLGTFIVMEPDDDDVRDNTTFDAMDLTTLFNADFNANFTNSEFTKSFNDTVKDGGSFTALQLAQYVCAQVNIELATTDFTHNDFIISSNQFTEGNSCRDVMKAISQLAFGWCRIGWDDKCYIDELVINTNNIGETETLTNNQYYSLNTKKMPFGPVNRVYIGPSMIEGEGVVTPDNEQTNTVGDIVINIYDNPITYTQELRQLAIQGAEKLFGLQYLPFETETIGHPWFKANKPIMITNMEDITFQSYPFTTTIKYTGHIKTSISTMEQTQAQKENGYKKSLYKDIRNVKIVVDKQAGDILLMNSSIKANKSGLDALETAVQQKITDTYSKTEIQQIASGVGADGVVVSSVTSSAGTFDLNGLTIEQSEKPDTKTNINGDGMIIYNNKSSSNQELLVVNSTGMIAENARVSTYFNIGEHSRLEDYVHTDYTEGTGVFWIGSD